MTLLAAITNVANEAGYSVDSTVIGSTDVTTTQLKAIANRVIQEMSEAYDWPKLWKSYSFDLASGVSTYALPGDFSYYHFDTFWDSSDGWRLIGPMTPQEYAEIIGDDYDPAWQRFTVRGVTDKEVLVVPTPGAGEDGNTIIFEYIANRPVRPRTWAAGQSIAASGEYTFYNGNYYTAGGSGTTGATPPTHTSGSASDGTITWTFYSGAYPSFLADTDEPILSQRILEQGMLERFAEIKGLEVVARYRTQLDEEFSKKRPGRTIYAGGNVVPPRAWARNGRVTFG